MNPSPTPPELVIKAENQQRAVDAVIAASQELRRATVELREACPHANVIEFAYKPEELANDARPPFRVCTLCGLREDGWDCGFSALDDKDGRYVKRSRREDFADFKTPQVVPRQPITPPVEHPAAGYTAWRETRERLRQPRPKE